MKFRLSGRAPDKLKLLALLVMLPITLGGCQPQVSSSVDPPSVTTEPPDISDSSEISSSSASTEISQSSPVSQSSSSTTDDTHVPDTSEPPDSSDNSGDTDSSESVNSEESSTSADTSEPVSESSETSETSEESSSSSEPISTPSSSSSSEPEPPPVVVIPDVATPTSPGTQLITGTNGVIDYSNAAQGYVSARYTGSSVKLKFRIEANGGQDNPDLDPSGATEYYALPYGNGTYTVTIFEQIPGSTGYAVAAQGSFDVQMNSSLSPFLYPNRYVNYNQSSDLVYKAAELCAGKTAAIDKIAAIFTWVSENVSYDSDLAATVKSGYTPDPDATLSRRTGICFDYASLMAAMLRSQSIPTRLAIGYAAPDIYHAWNEVYTEETGWITPELMLKNAGYNIVDATFYSSSPNKAQIAEYISNGANYSAVKYY